MADVRPQDPSSKERAEDHGPEDPRVRFAAERTLLAWVRTAIGLMGFGFVVARFGLFLREIAAARGAEPAHPPRLSLGIGTALVVLGVAVLLISAGQYRRIIRRLDRAEAYRAPRWSLGLIVSLLLAAVGIVLIVYLLAVGH